MSREGQGKKIAWIKRHGAKNVLVGGIMIGFMTILSIVSIWYTPYDPNVTELSSRFAVPDIIGGNSGHLLGADNLGRDILSRIMAGGRISLAIAGLAIVGTTVIGALLGVLSGFFEGFTDYITNMVAEMQNSIPTMLLIIVFLAVLGPSVITVAVVLAFSGWVMLFRTVRSKTFVEKNSDYVKAAKAMGASKARIIFKHILPNMASTIIVMSTMMVGTVIIQEANLSYLGVGVERPFPSWGRMISDGQSCLSSAWWVSIFPACAIVISVIGINLLGDGLRQMTKME